MPTPNSGISAIGMTATVAMRGASHLPQLSVGDLFAILGIALLLLTTLAPSKYAYCDGA